MRIDPKTEKYREIRSHETIFGIKSRLTKSLNDNTELIMENRKLREYYNESEQKNCKLILEIDKLKNGNWNKK